MEEKIIKKCASKQAGKPNCEKKSASKQCDASKKIGNKEIKLPKITMDPESDKYLLKEVREKRKLNNKASFTIFDLRDFGSKLFNSKNKKFNSLVDAIARELEKDNYGVAHDFADMNLNNEEFNGTEQGCLGAICGCITAYLVGLHIQQSEELNKEYTL